MGVRVRRCAVRRGMAAAVLAVVALVEQPVVAGAVPPPPPPTDDEFEASQDQAGAVAAAAGRLANQVAEADAALLAVQSDVALRREEANAAFVALGAARSAAAAARSAVQAARARADAATAQIASAQRRLDRFAAASYRQGSTIGSVSAFLGSASPQDLLARAELLEAVGGSQLDVLDGMQRARVRSANQHARAREAVVAAAAAERAATDAERDAGAAYWAVLAAEAAQAGRTATLRARSADLERQFAAAQQAVTGLADQRRRYADWVVQRDRAPVPDTVAAGTATAGSSHAVQTVINRAMAQRGVRYSWGGGDAHGATVGVRDGGIADAHGDYRAVGFDCSGLMIYAFAPVLGYALPHYSGSQYHAGRRVPLAHRRPGDMLFWATRGRIHHVALYLGDGRMIEAPYSGGVVRVTSVRFAGIMPYATRLL